MHSDYPYFKFLEIAKDCRKTIIEDALFLNSPDLYDALYSDAESQICPIKFELYELKWIEQHWQKIIETIDSRQCSLSEKKNRFQYLQSGIKNLYVVGIIQNLIVSLLNRKLKY